MYNRKIKVPPALYDMHALSHSFPTAMFSSNMVQSFKTQGHLGCSGPALEAELLHGSCGQSAFLFLLTIWRKAL